MARSAFSTANLPYRGGKGYQWEGGIREPYFIKVPWLNKKGIEIEYPVTGTDFYPTILDLANLDILPEQHMDGVSLKPLIEGDTLGLRPLFWHYPHYGNQGGDPSSIIREGKWKLIHYWEDDSNELYNLHLDPSEQTNIAAQNSEKTKELYDTLQSWLKEVNANMPEVDTAYNKMLDLKRDAMIKAELWPRLEQERKDMLKEDFAPNADWWGSQVTKD